MNPDSWLTETSGIELDQERRHDEWARLIERFESEGGSRWAKKLERCDEDMPLVCTCCGAVRKVKTRCDLRFCPKCAPALAAGRVGKYAAAVREMEWPLHVTLTVANRYDLDRATLVWLCKCFRRFRQTELGKLMEGGLASLELTNRGKGWHPHLHVLCECKWLSLKTRPPKKTDSAARKKHIFTEASKELGAAWARLVGQSSASVKVRRCYGERGNERAAVEVLKYSVKPNAMLECEGSATKLADAMDKVRLFRAFGTFYRHPSLKEPTAQPAKCGECKSVGQIVPVFTLDKDTRHALGC